MFFFLPQKRLAVFKYVKDTSARKEISFSVSAGDKTASVEFKLQQRRFRLDIKKKAIEMANSTARDCCWPYREVVETLSLKVVLNCQENNWIVFSF